MSTLTIGLAQINNSFSDHDYLPYAVGLLEAYVRHATPDPSRYRFLPPLFRRLPVDDAVEHLRSADVAGFSTYVWNIRLSLEIARRLKRARPEVLIVFGGPQVPDDPAEFLAAHPWVDLVVHNEGERTFLDLLEQLPARDFGRLDGVAWRAADGHVVRRPNAPRLRDLSALPSPYLSGVFEPLMAAHPGHGWIALWETNRGCPFACTFCDWGSATAAKVVPFAEERLRREVEWFAGHRIEFVFCCDANFGILPRDVALVEYVAAVKERTGFPRALSVQNTKNATERAYRTQKILSDAGLNKGVALSLQSVDPTTLEAVKRRNISLDTYLELQRRFTRDGVETYSDLILALPGETYDSFVDGVAAVIASGQHNRIQFNNLSILPNAEMGNATYREQHGLVTVESRIINIHGALESTADDIVETQQLVVATATMPAAAWRQARAFAWMTALLHFDKLLQIPFLVAHEIGGIGYRRLVEAFLDVDGMRYAELGRVRDFFLEFARAVQEGGPEYVYSADWLGIYWPADEYIFIQLTAERRLDAFYDEALGLLLSLLATANPRCTPEMIDDAVAVNRALVKQPFRDDSAIVRATHDVLRFHRAALAGQPAALTPGGVTYRIDRSAERWADLQVWSREVVWYGNKRGAYLHGHGAVSAELAGHF